jgi:hypothetical protein
MATDEGIRSHRESNPGPEEVPLSPLTKSARDILTKTDQLKIVISSYPNLITTGIRVFMYDPNSYYL